MFGKIYVLFGLEERTDPKKFWSWYWQYKAPVFAKDYEGTDRLQRYVVNQVTGVLKGKSYVEGVVELQWENLEGFQTRHLTPESEFLAPGEEGFRDSIRGHIGFWVEEHVIVGNGGLITSPKSDKNKKTLKLYVLFTLKPEVNPDKFWRYYINEKAPNFAADYQGTTGLQRYVINRVSIMDLADDKLATATKWAGVTEIQWESREAFENRCKTPEKDWHRPKKRIDNNWEDMIATDTGLWVEEHLFVGERGLIQAPSIVGERFGPTGVYLWKKKAKKADR
jgi:hypothetical protein